MSKQTKLNKVKLALRLHLAATPHTPTDLYREAQIAEALRHTQQKESPPCAEGGETNVKPDRRH